MTDMQNVPLRGQTGTPARDAGSVVPFEPSMLPTRDPGVILTPLPREDRRTKKTRLILWIGGGLLAAQLFAPPAFKPMVLAGQASADFYAQIMAASASNQEVIARNSFLAQKLADLEARWSEARAKCFWGGFFGPEAAQLCQGLVDQNFVPAIRQVKAQLGQ